MAEEVSPESKLYVKEEIEKSRKEFKEDLEKAQSKATRTFATIAMIVGLLGSLGIYGLVKNALSDTTITTLEKNAKDLHEKIVRYEKEANDILSVFKNDANEILSSKVTIGTIVAYGGEIEEKGLEPIEVREGWYFCNGAPLKSDDYPLLYDVISIAFGEPDPNSFNLPDLRGRFVRGVDHGTGRDPDANSRERSNEGGYAKDRVGSYQQDAFKKHYHKFEDWQNACTQQNNPHHGAGGATIPDRKTEIAGDSEETRPKNIYVNWIIKAK